MTIRVQATLRIGGTLGGSHLVNLAAAIADDHAYFDWSGEPFDPDKIEEGVPLVLATNEIIGGELCGVEAFCREHGLTYARWSGGHAEFCPVRVVFNGTGVPQEFPATIDDEVLIRLETIRALGSRDAIERHFAFANLTIPPFIVGLDTDDVPGETA